VTFLDEERTSSLPTSGLGRAPGALSRPSRPGNRRQRREYDASVDLRGPLRPAPGLPAPVRFERTLDGGARRFAVALVVLNVTLSGTLLLWVAHQEPSGGRVALVAFALLLAVEMLRLLQNLSLWLFAAVARDPVPVEPATGLRVALLTTIVPSKEPVDVLERTLAAMRRVEHDSAFDVWVLDEEDDPTVRRLATRLGVRHFSRLGRPEWNQPCGPFRSRTKAGNYNAWRAQYEDAYDVVVQLDPDHVPHAQFLRRTLGYFWDPDVAFVVAPQIYGNAGDGFVARAAAAQMYPFHAVVQRGGNGLDAPMLIGTNHVYRVSAWRQIGGYQDSIIEDHLTGLRVQSESNPVTGKPWKAVYTPDVVAVGEAPSTWTDYFNQQKRWARGVWEIACRHSPTLLRRLKPRQAVCYVALQLYYPGLGLVWLFGSLLLAVYLATGVTALSPEASWFLPLWASVNTVQFAMFCWLRRYNLAAHERREIPLNVIVLSAGVAPVYAAAAVGFLLRRRLAFVITAKGALASADSAATFKYHLVWAGALCVLLLVAMAQGFTGPGFFLWAMVGILTTAVPIFVVRR
jgi:cellulose synthase/poly-beta-1,6-N-acetylglucosamine synthase-like glycosyltransferase